MRMTREARALKGYQRYRLRKRGVDVPFLPSHRSHKEPARFWSFVDKSAGKNACWPWKAGKTSVGYGAYSIGLGEARKVYGAHQIALFFSTGQLPVSGRVSRHSCDNPACCNPAHLCWGTQSENIRDMVDRGRGHNKHARGSALPFAKLTEEKVVAARHARDAGESVPSLARRFGVSSSAMEQVISRKTWKHVNA